MRRQLAAPAAADLPRVAAQVAAVTAALQAWVARFQGRRDEARGRGGAGEGAGRRRPVAA